MSKHTRFKVLSVFLFAALFLAAGPALAGTVLVPLSGADVKALPGPDGAARFEGDDFQFPGQAGEPQLPYRVLKVLLPPGADLSSVSISLDDVEEKETGGFWDVGPVPPMATWDGEKTVVAWPEDRNIENGRDVDVYGADVLFPAERTLTERTGEIRGWKVVDVAVALFRYNPVTRKLMRLEKADVAVEFSEVSGKTVANGSADAVATDMVRDAVVNFDEMVSSYTGRVGTTRNVGEEDLPGYLIVTTQAIWDASDSLDEFVVHKTNLGFDVSVFTEADWGGGSGNEAAENLRAWLADNYLSLNTQYLLLIGNPHPESGDVPMKMLWPLNNNEWYPEYAESPSDLYYADLTGDWDLDGDGKYGEWGDDFGDGGIDTNWDVIVGRIPCYGSAADLDAILTKTIRYETADPATTEWRRNALLPMKPSDYITPGYQLGEEIKDHVLVPLGYDGYSRVYDENYDLDPAPEFTPCTTDNVTAAWTEDAFGLVAWWTHGSPTAAGAIMDLNHLDSLDDSHPSVVFQCSCLNAYPEVDNNLSYSLLINGAVLTVGATRVSWYWRGQTEYAGTSTNSGITSGFSKNLMLHAMDAGTALASLKQESYATSEYNWMNFTDFNVYGDPSLALEAAGSSTGSVTVTIDGPEEARWLLNRNENFESGEAVNVVSGVTYEISFSDVDGWIKPGAKSYPVSADIPLELEAKYVKRVLSGPTFVKAGGTGDGTSWDSPKDLADALRDAMAGETILAAEGLYRPLYDRTNNLPLPGQEQKATFTLKSGVTLLGGFPDGLSGTASGDRDPSLYRTVLTGDLEGDDETDAHGIVTDTWGLRGGNANHVVLCSGVSNLTVDGITVTAGHADGYGDTSSAGIAAENSTFRLADCTFSGNKASNAGGLGLLSSEAVFEGCLFTANDASQNGGGAYLRESTVSLKECRFSANSAGESGGGVESYYSGTTLADCTFLGNETGEFGGAVSFFGGVSAAVVQGCTFDGNISDYRGGAVDVDQEDPRFENCTFSANRASTGSALYSRSNSLTVTNCTFTGNDDEGDGNALYTFCGTARLTNCVFWDDTTREVKFYDSDATPVVSHCVIRGGTGGILADDPLSADHIITEDPCLGPLADNGGSTLTCVLLPGSSALDAGTSADVASVDQRGVPRPQFGSFDIGACEDRPGAVSVSLEGPEEEQWSLDGEGAYVSGYTVEGLPVGFHTVCFTSADHWRVPALTDVAVNEGATTFYTADYRLAVDRPASWSHVEAGEDVTLEWEDFDVFEGSVDYEVYMEDEGSFVKVPAERVDGTSVTLDLNGHTTYTLRVDADGFEGEPWTFTTPNRAPRLVRRSPRDGADRLPADTVLSWLYLDPDGDSVDYNVYLGDGEVLSLACSGDVTTFAPVLSCDCGYRWQIVASDRFEGMEAFEPGIASGDVWSFSAASDIHRITPPVPDAVLVAGGVNDVWVVTLASGDLAGLESALGEGVVPAETVLSLDVEPISGDVSSVDLLEALEETGTPIAQALPEGIRLAVTVSDDVNLVPIPMSLSFTEEQVGRFLSESTLLDEVHIFVIVGGRAFDLVALAGKDRNSLFAVTSDVDESGVRYFVDFRLYLTEGGADLGSAASGSGGVSALTGVEDAAFLVEGASDEGAYRVSVTEATVETASGGGDGCSVGPFSPGFLMLLLPLLRLRRK